MKKRAYHAWVDSIQSVNQMKALRKRLTSPKKERILSTDCLRTLATTSTLPWNSSLPLYSADFALAYVYFFILNILGYPWISRQVLHGITCVLRESKGDKQKRTRFIDHRECPNSRSLTFLYVSAKFVFCCAFTGSRDQCLDIFWGAIMQPTPPRIEKSIFSRNSNSIFIKLRWRMETGTLALHKTYLNYKKRINNLFFNLSGLLICM